MTYSKKRVRSVLSGIFMFILLFGINSTIKAQSADERFNDAYDNFDRGYVERAIQQFKRLVAVGHAESAAKLGGIYLYGDKVEKDLNEAIYWFKKAAEMGSLNAQFNLGTIYYNGYESIAMDKEESFKWYQMAARQGDIPAKFRLAILYETGEGGMGVSYARAMELYQDIAEGSSNQKKEAMHKLADLKYRAATELESVSFGGAIKWFQEICKYNDSCENQQFGVAEIYYKGRNFTKAARWYKNAVDEEQVDQAQSLLKLFVERGISDAKYYYAKYADLSDQEKEKYFAEAGNNGHKLASYEMYKIYDYQYNTARGKVSDIHLDKSLDWLKKSAIDGYATASLKLYKYYAKDGRDCEEARYWLKNARDNGSQQAEIALKGEDKYAKARLGLSMNACE